MSEVRQRAPFFEAALDECGSFGGVGAVQEGDVTWVGAEVDAGCACVEGLGAIGACCEVAAGAVEALEFDLTGSLELRGIR